MRGITWVALGLVAAGAGAQEPPVPPRNPLLPPGFHFRSGAESFKECQREGGGQDTLAAAAKGLAWLARQQKVGGFWEFAGTDRPDRVGATGLALLAFTGFGQTHRSGGKYTKQLGDAVAFLLDRHDPRTGGFGPDTTPTGHALATAALCELHALTRDRRVTAVAAAAVGHLVGMQRADGGWGGTASALEETGWAAFALHTARRSGVAVPAEAVGKFLRFLDARAGGGLKAAFGEPGAADARPGTTDTAIGLLGRHQFQGWGPDHAGFAAGVSEMLGDPRAGGTDRSRAPRTRAQVAADPTPPDPLRAFHATRVMYAAGGRVWAEWNDGPVVGAERPAGGMRDWLVATQSTTGNDTGSWAAPPGRTWDRWGRVGATALNVLTLAVYTRDPPLFPRPPRPE